MNNNITLLILTHKRNAFLINKINYYKNFGFQILIADSSDEKLEFEFSENIKYLHFPNMELFEKFTLSIDELRTKYIHICSDDDFILKDFVTTSYNFLENNSDYSSVLGRAIGFKFDNDNLDTQPIYFKTQRNINYDDIELRIDSLSKVYFHNFYSLYRLENLKLINNYIKKYHIYDFNMIERFIAMSSIILGKWKLLDELHMARDAILVYKKGTSSDTRGLLENYIESNSKEAISLKEALSDFLFNFSDELSKDKSEIIISNSLESYKKEWVEKNRRKYFDVRPSSKFELAIKKILCTILGKNSCNLINKFHWETRKNILIKKTKKFKAYPYYYPNKDWDLLANIIINMREVYEKNK